MTMTYTWKITGLKTKDVSDSKAGAVVQTYWEKTGTDENGNTGMFAGATPFTVDPTDDSGPFIPFDQLTEADVLAWIQAVVVGDYEKHVNERIQKNMEENMNVVVDATLPWATPAEAPPAA